MNFHTLDDVLCSLDRIAPDRVNDVLTRSAPSGVGVIAEYLICLRSMNSLPGIALLKSNEIVVALEPILHTQSFQHLRTDTSTTPRNVEFMRLPPNVSDWEDPKWIGFLSRFKGAADRAGLQPKVSAGLAGAVGEAASNVRDHSANLRSGLAGYRWSSSEFEYFVSDEGVGALASLRRCAEYENLTDHGEAVKLCLTDGVTSFGSQSKRGHGFRTLFDSIVSMGAQLRFRSGDGRVTIADSSPALNKARISKSASLTGFLMSVTIRK